ncbi:MAG: hypothetical protein Kow0075_11300 [Salibacteraceae bacterium]
MKQFLKGALGQLASWLIPKGSKSFYRIRDLFFTYPAEHLDRAVRFAQAEAETGHKYDRIIDIGAANGQTAAFFAKKFPQLMVECFEPNTEYRNELEAISKAHHNIKPHFIALGSEAATSSFYVTQNRVSSSLHEISPGPGMQESMAINRIENVKVATLDQMMDPGKTLIFKMDTQGSELNILRGGVETISRTKFVVLELMNHHMYADAAQYFEVDQWMRKHGFKLLDIIVTYRSARGLEEFDAIYVNLNE